MHARSRACNHLIGLTETRITTILNTRIQHAYKLTGDAHEIALDTNAHLITELRTNNIWPTRPTPPTEDDGA